MDEQLWTPDGELPARLAAVLDAARRPGDAGELAGEAAARAAFRAQHRGHRRRRHVVSSRSFPVKAALAAVGALSVVGVAAAATDSLPGRAGAAGSGAALARVDSDAASRAAAAGQDGPDRAARLGLCEAVRGPVAAERQPAEAALTTLAGRADRVAGYCAEVGAGGRGPAAAAATTGLCRAWSAGRGTERGGRELATAFAALARAAGGPGRVDAYCGATTRPAADPSRPAAADPTEAAPSRHAPAATPSHPVPPVVTDRPGGPGSRPAPAPTAPPGRGDTGTP